MERYVWILMFLATAFLTADCSEEPEPDPCFSKLHACTKALEESPYINAAALDYRFLIKNIDDICEKSKTAKECITSSYSICPERIRHQADTIISIADYVCSERGRELVADYERMVCYMDESKYSEFQHVFRLCGMEVGFGIGGPENACESATQLFHCTSSWLIDECGTAAGEIFNGIASRLLSSVAQQECSNELLKRGLGLLKKSL